MLVITKYGSVVIANRHNYRLEQLEASIREKLIDGTWFYANEWGIPDLHTHQWDNDLDHTFHEFENLTYTNELVSTKARLLFS